MAKQKKVIPYKKPIRLGIWKIVLICLILYIAFLVFNYTSKDHVSVYEVTKAQIADDTAFEGMIIRQEQIITTKKAGYINYYNPAGNRVGVGDIICTIDGTGNISDVLAELDSSQSVSNEEITNMRNVISNFQQNFSFSHYSDVYDYEYDIQNAVFEQSKSNLYHDLEQALQKNGQLDTFQKVTAKKTGIISYTIDGYEQLTTDAVTADMFTHKESVEKIQLRENETVESGGFIYKIITGEEWKLVVPIPDEYVTKLQDKDSIRITIKKDQISFQASLELQNRNGINFAVLTTSRFVQRYMNDRFLEIELNLNSAEGLKIPNTSILKKKFYPVDKKYLIRSADGGSSFSKRVYDENGKEKQELVSTDSALIIDGTYYISQGKLSRGDVLVDPQTNGLYTVGESVEFEGVYLVNQGYCKFVRVEKVYENAEYTIVKDKLSSGIAEYDHIVVDPSLLNENDFIQ